MSALLRPYLYDRSVARTHSSICPSPYPPPPPCPSPYPPPPPCPSPYPPPPPCPFLYPLLPPVPSFTPLLPPDPPLTPLLPPVPSFTPSPPCPSPYPPPPPCPSPYPLSPPSLQSLKQQSLSDAVKYLSSDPAIVLDIRESIWSQLEPEKVSEGTQRGGGYTRRDRGEGDPLSLLYME